MVIKLIIFLYFFLQECNIEEIDEEEHAPPAPSKSSKDKKANGPEKAPSLAFKFTSKVPYKTVLKGIYPFYDHCGSLELKFPGLSTQVHYERDIHCFCST